MSYLKFDDLLPRLREARPAGKGFLALCPAHDDHEPSLSIDRAGNGEALIHCYAGCKFKDIVAAFNGQSVSTPLHEEYTFPRGKSNIEEAYDYTDLSGNMLYQVIRQRPKAFRQRRPDGNGGWEWNLNGVERVIFRWSAVNKAIQNGHRIFLVEGEKDVLSLESLGLIATCNSGGAGKWTDALSESLRGADVVILPDNDEPGKKHAEFVAESLRGIAQSVRVVSLVNVPPKGDVTDWLRGGGTREALLEIAETSRLWHPWPSKSSRLIRYCDIASEKVDWLWRGFLARRKITVLDADPAVGKSLVTIDISARLSTGRCFPGGREGCPPCSVVMLNAEDGEADTIRPRLEAAGADLSRVCTISTSAPGGKAESPISIPTDIDKIKEAIGECDANLLVIDPLMAFLSGSINAHRDQEVRRAMHALKCLAEETGVAILIVRHLNKTCGPNPLYRGGGSIGIIAAARVGLVIAKDPDNPERRVLAVSKTNVGTFPKSLAFVVEVTNVGTPVIDWQGETAHTAAQLLTPDTYEVESQLAAACEFLAEALPGPANEIKAQAQENGIAIATLRRAKSTMGVIAEKRGQPGKSNQHWVWRLPEPRVKTQTNVEDD
ncbi:MAG: AAA family ATPase [Candidatus Hydrogenedentes bacterium]|nr:AAA family ATPase [Candidatus Hydrogenedentota bacterium]